MSFKSLSVSDQCWWIKGSLLPQHAHKHLILCRIRVLSFCLKASLILALEANVVCFNNVHMLSLSINTIKSVLMSIEKLENQKYYNYM